VFHWKIAYIRAMTAITGLDSGSTTLRPKNVLRDNGYAIAIVSVTLIRVPPTA
jgi:hypothetical protein